MQKSEVYQKELNKLNEIFKDVEKNMKKLAERTIDAASFLYSEMWELEQVIKKTGMVKIHPKIPELQKTTEASKEYLKCVNSYTTVIKTLYAIIQKNEIEPDDPFDEFMKQHKKE